MANFSNFIDAFKAAGLASDKQARKVANEKKHAEHKSLKSGARPSSGEVTAVVPVPQAAAPSDAERLERLYRGAALCDISGRRKFYFQTVGGEIDCIMLSDVAAALLERGKYALVESLTPDAFILVTRSTALGIEAIDKKRVIVLKRRES